MIIHRIGDNYSKFPPPSPPAATYEKYVPGSDPSSDLSLLTRNIANLALLQTLAYYCTGPSREIASLQGKIAACEEGKEALEQKLENLQKKWTDAQEELWEILKQPNISALPSVSKEVKGETESVISVEEPGEDLSIEPQEGLPSPVLSEEDSFCVRETSLDRILWNEFRETTQYKAASICQKVLAYLVYYMFTVCNPRAYVTGFIQKFNERFLSLTNTENPRLADEFSQNLAGFVADTLHDHAFEFTCALRRENASESIISFWLKRTSESLTKLHKAEEKVSLSLEDIYDKTFKALFLPLLPKLQSFGSLQASEDYHPVINVFISAIRFFLDKIDHSIHGLIRYYLGEKENAIGPMLLRKSSDVFFDKLRNDDQLRVALLQELKVLLNISTATMKGANSAPSSRSHYTNEKTKKILRNVARYWIQIFEKISPLPKPEVEPTEPTTGWWDTARKVGNMVSDPKAALGNSAKSVMAKAQRANGYGGPREVEASLLPTLLEITINHSANPKTLQRLYQQFINCMLINNFAEHIERPPKTVETATLEVRNEIKEYLRSYSDSTYSVFNPSRYVFKACEKIDGETVNKFIDTIVKDGTGLLEVDSFLEILLFAVMVSDELPTLFAPKGHPKDNEA